VFLINAGVVGFIVVLVLLFMKNKSSIYKP
jgi:hypothetical protein